MPQPTVPKKTLAVDIDEVIFPMVPDFVKYLDLEHKVRLTESDLTKYYFEEIWAGGPIEAAEIFKKYKNQIGVEIAPIKGAQRVLKLLSKSYKIIIITSRDSSFEEKTKAWLDNHFPQIFAEIHLLGTNESIHIQHHDKAAVCKQLGADYLIDDSLRHIQEVDKVGVKGLLFGDYPWNRAKKLPEGVTRVKSWKEVLNYFDAESRRSV